MYFKCRPSVETEHCIIVKGLTPTPSENIIGITTSIRGKGIINTRSPWATEFASGSIGNFWNPRTFSKPLPSSNDPSELPVPGLNYNEVTFVRGSELIRLSENPSAAIRVALYGQAFEFYTSNIPGNKPDGIILDLADTCTSFQQTDYAIPDDLYAIENNVIAWNTNHMLYPAFYGRPFTVSDGNFVRTTIYLDADNPHQLHTLNSSSTSTRTFNADGTSFDGSRVFLNSVRTFANANIRATNCEYFNGEEWVRAPETVFFYYLGGAGTYIGDTAPSGYSITLSAIRWDALVNE